MNGDNHLALIDGDTRRRAAVSHSLSGSGVHLEPFEDLAEVGARWPRFGMALVHDHRDVIADLMAQMVGTGNWLPVIAFAEAPPTERIVSAILNGAIDYVVWPFTGVQLAASLARARVRAGNLNNAKLREALARSRIGRLTQREREVLRGIASGHSNRAIAETLAISPRTVEIHRANMLHKIGASHTSEAIRIAIEAALFGEPVP
jgi:FixJ family two-component response regulator